MIDAAVIGATDVGGRKLALAVPLSIQSSESQLVANALVGPTCLVFFFQTSFGLFSPSFQNFDGSTHLVIGNNGVLLDTLGNISNPRVFLRLGTLRRSIITDPENKQRKCPDRGRVASDPMQVFPL